MAGYLDATRPQDTTPGAVAKLTITTTDPTGKEGAIRGPE